MTSRGGAGGWGLLLGIVLGGAAVAIGSALAYRAGEQGGKRETEGRSLTANDVSTFDRSQTDCAPCQEPTPVYRYISEGGIPNGKFWTPTAPEWIGNPTDSLALPPTNDGSVVYAMTLPPGAVVCRGRVAPQPAWDRSGGGEQYILLGD